MLDTGGPISFQDNEIRLNLVPLLHVLSRSRLADAGRLGRSGGVFSSRVRAAPLYMLLGPSPSAHPSQFLRDYLGLADTRKEGWDGTKKVA